MFESDEDKLDEYFDIYIKAHEYFLEEKNPENYESAHDFALKVMELEANRKMILDIR